MTNLELKKQRINQACNLTSLILASLPLILEFKKDEPNLGKRLWEQGTNLSLFIYAGTYYSLSSIFWPEPLSVTNRILLVPTSLLALYHLRSLVGGIMGEVVK